MPRRVFPDQLTNWLTLVIFGLNFKNLGFLLITILSIELTYLKILNILYICFIILNKFIKKSLQYINIIKIIARLFLTLLNFLVILIGIAHAQPNTLGELGEKVVYAGGPAQTVLTPSCMKLAWAPTEQEIDDCIKNPRASYVANGPEGLSALQIFAPGNGAKQTLAQCQSAIPGAIEQKPQAARLCAQMYIPDDGSSYSPSAGRKGAGGRTLFGLGVNSGQRTDNMFVGNGGTPPHLQYSVNIRMNRQGDGRMQLYSYHLNRSDVGLKSIEESRNGAYLAFDGEGRARRELPYFHFGDAKVVKSKWPLNEWFRMCMDVVINNYDENENPLANGLSKLSMYDKNNNIINSSSFRNVVYSRDSSGFVSSIQFDEKWNSETGNSGLDSNSYYRNFQVFFPNTGKLECN